jgi:hypothetical protein
LKSAAISFVTSSIGKAFESAQTGGKMENGAGSETQEIANVDVSGAAGIRRGDRLPSGKTETIKLSLNTKSSYDTADAAVKAQLQAHREEQLEASQYNKELLGMVIKMDGKHYYTNMQQVDNIFSASISVTGDNGAAVKGVVSGFVHTHPDGSSFSGQDYKTPADLNVPGYLGNTKGEVWKFDPAGAKAYKRYVDGLVRSGSIMALEREIDVSNKTWKISKLCEGSQPCN